MLIKKLRSEPEIFDTVEFSPGINFITGERLKGTKEGNKTNGVGKSILVNFIDFCLLSDYKKNRISKVPTENLPLETNIILEFTCEGKEIMIIRSRKEQNTPTIYINGVKKFFSSLNDARNYLSKNIFGMDTSYSLREMISPFKRKEKNGFNEIDNPDGSNNPEESRIIPYLCIFGLNIDLYRELNDKVSSFIEVHKYSKSFKNDIEQLGVNISEAAAHTNDLKSRLENIDTAVEELSQHELYETISEDISNLDFQLEKANAELVGIKEEIKKIECVPEYQKISKNDILAVYNDCKKSLGDLILREIDEIEKFKSIIDNFKIDIISQRKKTLLESKEKISKKINRLSKQYHDKTSVLDKKGNLRSLKTFLHEKEVKKQEYNKISFLFEQYEEQEKNKITVKAEREEMIVKLRADKEKQKSTILKFQETILELHEHLYGNRRASFDIEIKEAKRFNQKVFASFHMETDDSGSARTAHEKILIFDLSLLFCPATRKRHPKFIIHDGAFEGVNEDTKFQVLNWLDQQQDEEFQYIVTINRDSFESQENDGKFMFDFNQYVKAEYTKDNRFLKKKYIEQKI